MIRDHDFIETWDGWLFCIVGDIHPPQRFFAYPKYVPGDGPWKKGEKSFSRTLTDYSMIEFKKLLNLLKKIRPKYVYKDFAIGAEMSAVPADEVKKHYSCGDGLRLLMRKESRDGLERLALSLVKMIVDEIGVEVENLGITGSLLLGIHHEKSDIDLIVYGRREYWRVIETLMDLGYIKPKNEKSMINRILNRYPISREDAVKIVRRMRYRGVYDGREFSIHGVRKPEEMVEKYSDKIYRKVGLGSGILRVEENLDSCFNPSIYKVRGEVEVYGIDYPVEQMMCYDLTFSSMFEKGDIIEVYGKLEHVEDRAEKKEYYSMLIGSIEAAGREYIKII